LLEYPAAVTTMLPLVAPVGTVNVTEVDVEEVTGTARPLRVMVGPMKAPPSVAAGGPKKLPVIVTEVPGGPEFGETEVIDGANMHTHCPVPLGSIPHDAAAGVVPAQSAYGLLGFVVPHDWQTPDTHAR
jgi:hypothetical protein